MKTRLSNTKNHQAEKAIAGSNVQAKNREVQSEIVDNRTSSQSIATVQHKIGNSNLVQKQSSIPVTQFQDKDYETVNGSNDHFVRMEAGKEAAYKIQYPSERLDLVLPENATKDEKTTIIAKRQYYRKEQEDDIRNKPGRFGQLINQGVLVRKN